VADDTPNPTDPGNDPDQHFQTDHLRTDMKGRSVRGGAVTVGAGAISFVISMASTPILARLLTPHDFGLIGMVAGIIGFIVLFKDMGLSIATIQKEKINHKQVSTLFWINIAISVCVMLATIIAAPVIAWFYQEPVLLLVTLFTAPAQLLSGLTIQHQALLKRQMRFGTLAGINLTAQLVAIGVGITLAIHDYEVFALVTMPLSNAITTMMLVWLFCRWRPGRPVRGSGVREMLKFGGNLTGFNVVNYFVRELDNILIGKFGGTDQLGMYKKAYSLLMLPIRQINTPITSVAIPALSRMQNDPEGYRRYYRKAISVLVFVGMPAVAFATVAAEKVVLIVLGDQWLGTVNMFIALSPAAFIGTFNVATGWVYMSMGTTDRQFRLGILTSAITVAAFAAGVWWGRESGLGTAMGVAIALSATFVVMRYPSVWYCFRGTPLRVRDLGVVLWRPTLASILAGAVVYVVDHSVDWSLPLLISFIADFVVYSVAYLAVWFALPGGKSTVLETFKLVRELRRPKTKAEPE